MTYSSRQRTALRLFLLTAVLLSCLAAPAQAQPTIGVGAHLMWGSSSDPIDKRQLDLARGMGAQMVRVDAGWATAEWAGKGQWSSSYLAKLDSLVSATQARGMRLLLVWWRSPPWATSVAGVHNAPPVRPRDYADSIATIAARYRDRPVDFEIWNEPNSDAFFQSPDNARDYAALLKAAYSAIKGASPRAVVVGGALMHADATFTRSLYGHGIKGYMDGFSLHPYTEDRDPLLAYPRYSHVSFMPGIKSVRDVQVAFGDATPLWLTEFGWNTGQLHGSGYPAWKRSVTLEQQADYTRRGIDFAQTLPYVANAAVYLLRDDGSDPLDDQDNFGLVRRDYTAKPAYQAFRDAVSDAAPRPQTVSVSDLPPGRKSLRAPGAPVVIRRTATRVSLRWGSVVGHSAYRLYTYRGGRLVKRHSSSRSAGTVRGLRSSTRYAFRVSAVMSDGRVTPLGDATSTRTKRRCQRRRSRASRGNGLRCSLRDPKRVAGRPARGRAVP